MSSSVVERLRGLAKHFLFGDPTLANDPFARLAARVDLSMDLGSRRSMTAFIREHGLLTLAEIDEIVAQAPVDLLAFQEGAARVPLERRASMCSWLTRFEAGWNGSN